MAEPTLAHLLSELHAAEAELEILRRLERSVERDYAHGNLEGDTVWLWEEEIEAALLDLRRGTTAADAASEGVS